MISRWYSLKDQLETTRLEYKELRELLSEVLSESGQTPAPDETSDDHIKSMSVFLTARRVQKARQACLMAWRAMPPLSTWKRKYKPLVRLQLFLFHKLRRAAHEGRAEDEEIVASLRSLRVEPSKARLRSKAAAAGEGAGETPLEAARQGWHS
jgi:hypothetical protein